MFKPCLFIIGLTMAMASGCGKGEEQAKKAESKAQPEAKSKKEPAPASKPPPPAKAAKTPKIKSVAEIKKTPEQEEEDRFLESLRPQHEGKPSTLKIELEKLRAKGEPVTFKELDAWYKAVPPAKNGALAFLQTTNAVPKNGVDLWVAVNRENRRQQVEFPFTAPAMRTKVRAYLVAHQALYAQQLAIAQRYPANQPARFPIDLTRGPGTLLPHLVHFNASRRPLIWRSKYYATQPAPAAAPGQVSPAAGYQQEAVTSILVLLHNMHWLDKEPLLISFFVQTSGFNKSIDPLETLLNWRQLTDPQLVSLQHSYASFNWPQIAANGLIAERVQVLDIEAIARTGTKQQVDSIDPDRQLLGKEILYRLRLRTEAERDEEMTTCIGMMNQFIEAVRKGYPGLATYDDEDGPFQTTWKRYDAATKSGIDQNYFYARLLMLSLRRIPARLNLTVANQQLAFTSLAIERYRLANQWRLPKTLQELIPNYLLAHPFDPYTGKPLAYIPNANGSYELRAEKSKNAPLKFKVNPANRIR